MKIEDLLSHLSDVRRCGEGYMARCPAHDDRHQSLSVSPGEEGRVLIKCHAGCSVTAVMSAMGLRLADLFPDRELAPRDSWPEAEYVYPGGQVKKVKVRHADGGKHFYWQHLENGKWRAGRGTSAPLYWRRDPGPEGLLFLVEGEKDVDTLDALGLCALSLPDGAKSNWRPEYAAPMEGKLCVLLPDNDDPGRAYARDLAERLYDKASALKLVDLRELWPEAPEHADVTDYLASGEKLPLLQALLEKVSSVPDMEKPAPSEGVLAGFPRASDLQEEEARWLVPGWIPEGGVTLIAAEGGLGKTTLWVELLSAFSAGRACLLDPPGYERRPLDVAFCTTEDSLRKRLLKKLRLADGDLRRIRAMDMRSDKSGFLSRFKFGTPEMEQVLRTLRPAVCVFDPIQSFLPPEVNMGSRNAMRHCFNQLSALGEELGITFLLICHTNKRLRASGRDRIADSADLWDIARSVIMAGYTGAPGERYLSHEKSSNDTPRRTVLYEIDGDGRIRLRGYTWKRDRDFVEQKQQPHTAPVREDCKQFILSALESAGGQMTRKQLEDAAVGEGYSPATLKRAREELQDEHVVVSFPTGSPKAGNRVWYVKFKDTSKLKPENDDTPVPFELFPSEE